MPLGESSCPGGSEYVWQGGVEGVLGWVRAAEVYPIFKKKEGKSSVKKTDAATIFKISLPKRISVGS